MVRSQTTLTVLLTRITFETRKRNRDPSPSIRGMLAPAQAIDASSLTFGGASGPAIGAVVPGACFRRT